MSTHSKGYQFDKGEEESKEDWCGRMLYVQEVGVRLQERR